MKAEINVCYYCKKLVTFTNTICPNCHQEKRFIFENKQKEHSLAAPNRKKQNDLQTYCRWEYKQVLSPSENELKKLGLIGWELVTTVPITVDSKIEKGYQFVFKRKLV